MFHVLCKLPCVSVGDLLNYPEGLDHSYLFGHYGPFRKALPAVDLSGFPARVACGFLAVTLLITSSHLTSQCGLSSRGPRVFQGFSWNMGEDGSALPSPEESRPAPAVPPGTCHVQRRL